MVHFFLQVEKTTTPNALCLLSAVPLMLLKESFA